MRGCPCFCAPGQPVRKKKWPLTIPSTIVKGHFCSVLVSNICWLTSLSVVFSAPACHNGILCNVKIHNVLGGFLKPLPCFWKFTCTLVSPLCAYKITQKNRKINMQYCIKYIKCICAKHRFTQEKHTTRLTFQPGCVMIIVLGCLFGTPFFTKKGVHPT